MVPEGLENFTLKDEHRNFLHRCALSGEIIDSRPYCSLTAESRVYLSSRWGFSDAALFGEGIFIPRYSPDGTLTYPQIRYNTPQQLGGKERKYNAPRNSGGVVDVHPAATERLLRETSEPLIFVESIKGADALLSSGILAAGFHGVWGWRVDSGPSREFRDIPLDGRDVAICFDVDARRNPNSRRAISEFGGFLTYEGARVYVVEIPESVGPKAGIDDYLSWSWSRCGGGRIRPLENVLREEAR